MAWVETGGGAVAEVVLCCVAEPVAIAASEGTSEDPANDTLGAGPIAAPTATPSASIPAASTAATRIEGSRGTPAGGLAAGEGSDADSEAGSVSAADAEPLDAWPDPAADVPPCAPGGVGLLGVLVMVSGPERGSDAQPACSS